MHRTSAFSWYTPFRSFSPLNQPSKLKTSDNLKTKNMYVHSCKWMFPQVKKISLPVSATQSVRTLKTQLATTPRSWSDITKQNCIWGGRQKNSIETENVSVCYIFSLSPIGSWRTRGARGGGRRGTSTWRWARMSAALPEPPCILPWTFERWLSWSNNAVILLM